MCTGKGYVERELLSLCSRERGYLFRARFAHLSKVLAFCGTFECTGKGFVERKTAVALLEWEGGTYSGLTLLASQKWWFWWHFCVHSVRGM